MQQLVYIVGFLVLIFVTYKIMAKVPSIKDIEDHPADEDWEFENENSENEEVENEEEIIAEEEKNTSESDER